MARVEATAEFAREVAALKPSFTCGLKPDRDNGKCADIRIPAHLPTVLRTFNEHSQYAVESVPVVCLHCVGARQGKWANGDILVKEAPGQDTSSNQ